MKGMTLKNTIHKIINENPTTTFLVDGTSLRETIYSYNYPESAKFIFVHDCMAVGSASPTILSKEFIALRAAAYNGSYYSYTVEEYENDCVSSLRQLSKTENSEIVLIQWDCYVSQIWQLTMQAYIEQLGIATSVKRLCIYEDCKSDFLTSRFDEISVVGAHDAYCQLVCRHEPRDLTQFLVSTEAVKCYLDINSSTGSLREYIYSTSSAFDNPYHACGQFLHDYQKWGLGDAQFLNIAMDTLSHNPKYAKTIKQWTHILNKRHSV